MPHCTYCEEDFDYEELDVVEVSRRISLLACSECLKKIESGTLKPEDY